MTTQKRGPGAPAGNQNRRLPEEATPKRGAATKFTMPYEEWEAFKSACDLAEGTVLSEEDYREKWRMLASVAARAFIERHQGLVDPEALIL